MFVNTSGWLIVELVNPMLNEKVHSAHGQHFGEPTKFGEGNTRFYSGADAFKIGAPTLCLVGSTPFSPSPVIGKVIAPVLATCGQRSYFQYDSLRLSSQCHKQSYPNEIMWILPLVGYVGVVVGFSFLTLSIGTLPNRPRRASSR